MAIVDFLSSVDDVIVTDQLFKRAPKPPRYQLEAEVLASLADELAERPSNLLQRLCDLLIEKEIAGSAGISLIERADGVERFRWVALAGQWGMFKDGTMPFDASPCGTVIARNALLLFEQPERFFPAAKIDPPIHEILLVPFHAGTQPIGTVWISSHDPNGRFDTEDTRLLQRLGRFASAAHQMTTALASAEADQATLEMKVAERSRTLLESEQRQAFLLDLSDALAPLTAPLDIAQLAATRLGEQLGVSRVFYGTMEDDRLQVDCDYTNGVRSIVGSFSVEDFGFDFLDAYKPGSLMAVSDARTDGRLTEAARANLAARDVAAFADLTLFEIERCVGILAVQHDVVRHWTPIEEQLIRDVGERVRWAIERARVQIQLKASEERFRRFGEASQDILWIRDARTLQWTYLTAAFEKIYGRSRESALSGDNYRSWQDLIVPADRAHAVAAIDQVRRGDNVTFEYRICRPNDGAIRWLRDTDFPITDAEGNVVLVGGIGHDFTDVREAELRLKTLVEGIPQLVWRAVDGGAWTWASPQWIEYTDQRNHEYRGQGWLNALHADDRKSARDAWAQAIENGGFEVEYRIKGHADGQYRWFKTRATPVRDRAGTITEWLGTSTDIDDLRALQSRQHVLVAELQHRTRNLIAVVRSTADKTMRRADDISDFRSRFRDRLDALARVQGLLSRLEEHDRVTFDELLRTDLTGLGVLDDGHADRVTLDGPGGVRLRSSTVQTLAMALHELATNAVKYGALHQPDGHLAIRWRVEDQGDGGQPWLHIDWRESGVVMPAGPAPIRTGHGRELIERALPYQLQATTSYDLGPDGVHCTIGIPVSASTNDEGSHDG